MNNLWLGLLANMAIVALVVSLWSNVNLPIFNRAGLYRGWELGVVFGLGAIGMMTIPVQLSEGFFIDLRMTLIGTAAFIGGPVAGLVATLLAACFRLYVGGAGLLIGFVGIFLACFAGLIGFRMKQSEAPTLAESAIFAVTLALCALAPSFILALSRDIGALPPIRIPYLTLIFLATLMASLAIGNELRRREADQRNHMYRRVIDSLPDALSVKDSEGLFVMANPATASLLRVQNTEEMIGKTYFDYLPEDIAHLFQQDEIRSLEAGAALVEERSVSHLDGSTAYFSMLKAPFVDADGKVIGIISHSRDITDKKLLEMALAQSDRRAAEALSGMADGVVMFDKDLTLVFCNERYRAMFSMTADLRVPGTAAAAILYASIARGEFTGIPQDQVTHWVGTALGRLREAGTVQFPMADGRWIESRTRPTPDGSCFVICSDITATKQNELQLKDMNSKLSVLAETDSLTGLLNRRAFDAVMDQEMERVGRGDTGLSLLMVDVDYFKRFNDTYGHAEGDTCLQAVADCLRASGRRPNDRAARYGGEEMALVLPDTDEQAAIDIAEDFCTRLRDLRIPHSASHKGIVSVSVGVATLVAGSPVMKSARLVSRADEALYAAKGAGRDCVRAWEPSRPRIVHSDNGQR